MLGGLSKTKQSNRPGFCNKDWVSIMLPQLIHIKMRGVAKFGVSKIHGLNLRQYIMSLAIERGKQNYQRQIVPLKANYIILPKVLFSGQKYSIHSQKFAHVQSIGNLEEQRQGVHYNEQKVFPSLPEPPPKLLSLLQQFMSTCWNLWQWVLQDNNNA